MKKIKIGQIGIGHNHGSEKMNTLRRLSHLYEVVGVVEDDPAWREKRSGLKAYENLPWFTEEELFQIPGLEAVAVETEDPELVRTARRCAERGLHIHMDKPGGETLPPFKELLDEYQRKNLAVQLGYMYRNNPAVEFCFKAARAGWLGDIFEVHAVMSRYDGDEYRNWLKKFPGGVMYIFGGHLIDLVISLLGRPDKVTAFQRSTRNDGLFDNGLAVMEYPRATATIRTTVTEVDGMKHRRLIVCGTRGSVEVCPLEYTGGNYAVAPLQVRLTLLEGNDEYPAGTHEVAVPLMSEGRYGLQLIELARIIRGEIANPYPPEHEFLVQEALLAAAGYVK